jgi:hypothetical protein
VKSTLEHEYLPQKIEHAVHAILLTLFELNHTSIDQDGVFGDVAVGLCVGNLDHVHLPVSLFSCVLPMVFKVTMSG